MSREITLTVPDENSGFKVGDKFTFPNNPYHYLNNATITSVHILTPEEIAEQEKRDERRKQEEEYNSHFCPECGQCIG